MHNIDWNTSGHMLDAWIVVPAVLLFAALATWLLRRLWVIHSERR